MAQRNLRVAVVQAAPAPLDAPWAEFRRHLTGVLATSPGIELVAYPELHLFGTPRPDPARRRVELEASAEPLDGERCAELGRIAAAYGIWLVPGTICERGPEGELFNTMVVFSPNGQLVASYRKIFPWRPFEPYDCGTRFVVFDLPDDAGTIGLNICYDAWFPESSRHLAWYGAQMILNLVQTTTPDRAQELVLARANAIVNQVFMVSVNCAGPNGMGRSIVVDPEGVVLAEAPDAEPTVLTVDLDLEQVHRVRRDGTAGTNRMWSQFGPDDPVIDLPLYAGRIDPSRWTPPTSRPQQISRTEQ